MNVNSYSNKVISNIKVSLLTTTISFLDALTNRGPISVSLSLTLFQVINQRYTTAITIVNTNNINRNRYSIGPTSMRALHASSRLLYSRMLCTAAPVASASLLLLHHPLRLLLSSPDGEALLPLP